MNFSHFFIRRPIFAGVLSILIFLLGMIAMNRLPISEYPEVVPPQIVVRAVYPGANPKTISETVAVPLELQINGVENALYISSQSTSDGVMTLTVTFKLGTDIDKAQVLVQNRVSQALPKLPEEVRRLGVLTIKSSPDLTMVVHLISKDGRYDDIYVRNYATLQVKDVLARVKGVGQVSVFGSGDYAMRVWLDPQKVAAKSMTAKQVVDAIREQNVQVAAGAVGQQPVSGPVPFELQINTKGRLITEEEFDGIVLKTGPNGEKVLLKDVARIELGAGEYALRSLLNNKSAVALPIFQQPGSNALELSATVRKTMAELKASFPEGLDYEIVYDPTVFVRKSIDAVVHTLFEAVLLVVLVVILFLQTWRASIIPLAAVPVSLVGTFAVMSALGFSINALSLFGLVLAIGIVVDDAIVVVENVERNIRLGRSAVEATEQAMREVTGPIVATALVLCAVFVPTAFISGLTGQFYKQFAITIAISTVISAFNSLTLSPALCALLLKDHHAPKDRLTRIMDGGLGWIFRPFNRFFEWASARYAHGVARVIRASVVALVVYLGLVALTGWTFTKVPVGFVPVQDKQYLIAFAQLPDAASLDRTDAVIRRMSEIAKTVPGVANSIAFPGLSINGFSVSPNSGIVFVGLDDFENRTTPDKSGLAIAGKLNGMFSQIQEALVLVVPPPPVNGLGTSGGFRMQVEDRSGVGYEQLYAYTQQIIGRAYSTNALSTVYSTFQVNVPQLDADVDRVKAKIQGVSLTELFDTMQIYLGSLYVNDFNRFGRTYQVVAQADAPHRDRMDKITQLKVRNSKGQMVPIGSLVRVTEGHGPDRVMRYNGYPTAEINGNPGPGFSSGQGEAAIEAIAAQELPKGMTYEWTDLTYQQRSAGNTAIYIYPLCLLLVFLVLAAQYESLSLPLAIILIVPMCLLSAMTGLLIKGAENNVFTQIGLIVLVGLACKNAILIVEFAKAKHDEGMSTVDSALEACRLRLRPILMTSIAFIAGVYPLVASHGAGAEMRQAMGVAVFSGMIGVTVFGLFLTPVFFVVIMNVAAYFKRKPAPSAAGATPTGGGGHASVAGAAVGLILLASSAVAVGGVLTVGPDYKKPVVETAPSFKDVATNGWKVAQPSDEQSRGQWWLAFNDPVLSELAQAATTNGFTLRAALARVEQARASARVARGSLFPSLSVDPSFSRDKYSPNQIPNFGSVTANTWKMPLDLSYEIDLWGRVRRATEAARNDAESSLANFYAAQLSVQAEVAQNYFMLRSTDNQREIVEETRKGRAEALKIIKARVDAGSATDLDLARAETELATVESEYASLERSRVSLESSLGILTGRDPLSFRIADTGHYHPPVPVIPVGLPLALLERRPDVAAAERRMASANAQIGVAKGAFFPVIRLTGSGGFVSADVDQLFKWDSHVWSLGPSVSLPIFAGGRNKAGLARARKSHEEATYNYRQQVLVALGEVQETLTGLKHFITQVEASDRAAEAAQKASAIARLRYDGGISGYLEVVDAERSALQIRREAARSHGQQRIATVQLIKALGGSWDESAK